MLSEFASKDLTFEELKLLRETDSDIKGCFIFTGNGNEGPMLDDYDFFFSDDEEYERINLNILDSSYDENETLEQRAEIFNFNDEIFEAKYKNYEEESLIVDVDIN